VRCGLGSRYLTAFSLSPFRYVDDAVDPKLGARLKLIMWFDEYRLESTSRGLEAPRNENGAKWSYVNRQMPQTGEDLLRV